MGALVFVAVVGRDGVTGVGVVVGSDGRVTCGCSAEVVVVGVTERTRVCGAPREISRSGVVTGIVADAVRVGAVAALAATWVCSGAVGTSVGPVSPQASSPAAPISSTSRIRRGGVTAESTVPLAGMATGRS